MSSLRPWSAVSQITGAPAALTAATSRSGSIWPLPRLAWRSRPDPASSLESLQCTRSMRPVIALIRSTASVSASPAAQVWQVSRQNPIPVSPMTSQSRDGVEAARHRVIAAGGVFQVDGNLGFQPVQRLAPALEALVDVVVVGDVPTVHDHRRCANVGRRSTGLLQDLARRDPHAIVRRRKVDQVGRMHVDGQGRGFQRGGVVPRLGSLPALRIAKENLHYVSAFGLRCGQRIGWADMRTNEHNPSLVRPIW